MCFNRIWRGPKFWRIFQTPWRNVFSSGLFSEVATRSLKPCGNWNQTSSAAKIRPGRSIKNWAPGSGGSQNHKTWRSDAATSAAHREQTAGRKDPRSQCSPGLKESRDQDAEGEGRRRRKYKPARAFVYALWHTCAAPGIMVKHTHTFLFSLWQTEIRFIV